MKQRRIDDFGIHIGTLPRGPRNKISDVAGVTVGHGTIHNSFHHTGVTVVLPPVSNPFAQKLPAACFVWNGFGKTAGTIQIQELGTLETPIALTNTLNVGLISDAMISYMIDQCEKDHVPMHSINPVICECNDGTLNQIQERVVTKEHLYEAIQSASPDFEEGSVGAGAGTICHGLKGGIGSASRQIEIDGTTYTLGILVQSNYGRLSDLTIQGKPVGREYAKRLHSIQEKELDKGSIIMIVATDLPVSDRQLTRILKRASVGLARLGSYVGNGSGEVMIGFSTAWTIDSTSSEEIIPTFQLQEASLDKAFHGIAEACEEAVLNSMICADTVTGYTGKTIQTLRDFL